MTMGLGREGEHTLHFIGKLNEADLGCRVRCSGGDCIMVARSNFHLATRWRGQMFNLIIENEGIGYKAIASGRGQILIPPPAERL